MKGTESMNWFLIYTKPKHEDHVTYRLTTAGFDILNPKIKEKKFYRSKLTEIVSPLFPSYIFARFDKLRDYHLIKFTRGVKWVLGNENGPFEVSDGIVSSIESRISDGVIAIKRSFTEGDIVSIQGGPFEGITAVFEREMNGIERVSVLLQAVNLRVVVDGRMLAKIG